MRTLTDRYKVSREKLAYICDSTSAPVSILIPITGWAVFVAGLLHDFRDGFLGYDDQRQVHRARDVQYAGVYLFLPCGLGGYGAAHHVKRAGNTDSVFSWRRVNSQFYGAVHIRYDIYVLIQFFCYGEKCFGRQCPINFRASQNYPVTNRDQTFKHGAIRLVVQYTDN